MEENPVEVVAKKKRKKRTSYPIKIWVDGKLYRGSKCVKHGEHLILSTVGGKIFINMDHAKGPVEVQGEIDETPSGGHMTYSGGQATSTPLVTSPAAEFNKRRNAAMAAALQMPRLIEAES